MHKLLIDMVTKELTGEMTLTEKIIFSLDHWLSLACIQES